MVNRLPNFNAYDEVFGFLGKMTLKPCKKTNSAVTLQEIAVHCGVSKGSVSRALNGDLSHLNRATMDRIKAVAAELGYDPGANHAARRLALRKGGLPVLNHTIGLLMSERFYETNYYQALLRGVLEVLAPEHYGLLLGYMYKDVSIEDLPYAFRRDDLDAVIACRPESELRPLLGELKLQSSFSGRPLISMIYRVEGCSAVVPDHQMAAYLLARHLLSQGHRHLLHFVPDDAPPFHPFELRLAGYRQAYREIRIDPGPYLQYMPYPYTRHLQKNDLYDYAEETERMLDAHPEITAVLTPYDGYAGVLIDVLSKCGKRVPEDISVVGLDNTDPGFNQQGENILTTIRMPLRAIGRQAAAIALRRISGEEKEEVTVMLPVELIERASTSPPGNMQAETGRGIRC